MKDETIYIVSGYMRTGTSMMMKALEAGGMKPVFSDSREKMNERFGDKHYKPNPQGFYELSKEELKIPRFPLNHKGKLVKLLWGIVWKFPVHDYKVVFMMRNPEEIRQSYEAGFGGQPPDSHKSYKEIMKDTINVLENRRDTIVDTFQFREVVADPLKHFKRLKKSGWPIDVKKAIKVIDPSQVRFKIEELDTGV